MKKVYGCRISSALNSVLSIILVFGYIGNCFAAAELNSVDFEVNQELGEQLRMASHQGDLAKVKKLIAQKAPVDYMNSDGSVALRSAAMQGWSGVVAELLKAKALVDLRLDSSHPTALLCAMHYASELSNCEVRGDKKMFLKAIQLLVWAGADHQCSYSGKFDTWNSTLCSYAGMFGTWKAVVAKFPTAIPVIEEARVDVLLAENLIQEHNCLQPHLIPQLANVVKEYLAMPFTALDPDGKNVASMMSLQGE